MPDGIKFSELQSTLTLGNNDLAAVSHDNGDSTYTSVKVPMTQLGQKVVNDIDYTQALNTTSKKPIGAINELKNELLNIYPVLATSPAPIANFSTDLALPLKSLTVEIKPKQASGTPTPSNPLPISGTDTVIVTQTGKNLFDSSISSNINTSIKAWASNDTNIVAFLNTLKQGTYKLSYKIKVDAINGSGTDSYGIIIAPSSGAHINTRATESNVSVGSIFERNATITIGEGTTFANVWFYTGRSPATSADSCTFYDFQLEVGNQATTFEAYSATTKTVSLPSTVFGGEVDCIGGSGANTWSDKIDLGDLSWTKDTTSVSGYTVFYADIITREVYSDIMCECYKFVSGNRTVLASNDLAIANWNTTATRFAIRDDSKNNMTADEFKTNVTGQKLCYILATPTQITLANPIELTAQSGVNNVFGDTDGNTSVEFRESVQKYVDDNIAAVQALIL